MPFHFKLLLVKNLVIISRRNPLSRSFLCVSCSFWRTPVTKNSRDQGSCEIGRELTRERTLAGLEAAKRRGRTGGCPRSLNNEQRETLKELLEQEKGVSYIARTLNTSRFTIYREINR